MIISQNIPRGRQTNGCVYTTLANMDQAENVLSPEMSCWAATLAREGTARISGQKLLEIISKSLFKKDYKNQETHNGMNYGKRELWIEGSMQTGISGHFSGKLHWEALFCKVPAFHQHPLKTSMYPALGSQKWKRRGLRPQIILMFMILSTANV